MIGTADGFWYAFTEHGDGSCDYEVMHFDMTVAAGHAASPAEMHDIFDRVVGSHRLAIDIALIERERATIH